MPTYFNFKKILNHLKRKILVKFFTRKDWHSNFTFPIFETPKKGKKNIV